MSEPSGTARPTGRQPLTPGETVGDYVVEEYVGGGGMASVYRVRHAILGHQLALKVLAPDVVAIASTRRRFLQEGRLQAALRHPAIVMVTDAVVDARRGIAGLVMEYVEGPTLGDLVRRMDAPPDAALVRAIAIPVCRALHHIHREGVVHRDVKPGNILLSRDSVGAWYPRLADFGIAHVVQPGEEIPEGRSGTPAFMSPEQVRNEAPPSPGWDVWAMGVLLYELATGGHHPFEGSSDEETFAAILRGTPRHPNAVAPSLDTEIAEIILACIAQDPQERLGSCALLADRLAGATVRPGLGHRVPDHPAAALVAGAISRALRSEGVSLVGSAPDSSLVFDDAGVEAQHCVIAHRDGGWWLSDTSLSGTHVNGARVEDAQLADGDLIRMGSLTVHFVSSGSPIESGNAPPPQGVEPEPTAPPEPLPSRPHSDWWIEVRDAGEVHEVVLIDEIVLGPDPAHDVYLPRTRHRVCIRRVGVDVVAEDTERSGILRIDGQQAHFRQLRGGEQLRFGSVTIRVHRRLG